MRSDFSFSSIKYVGFGQDGNPITGGKKWGEKYSLIISDQGQNLGKIGVNLDLPLSVTSEKDFSLCPQVGQRGLPHMAELRV